VLAAILYLPACNPDQGRIAARVRRPQGPTAPPIQARAPALVPVRPAEPWPGPRGFYLFREAEDLSLFGKAWQIESTTRPGPHGRSWASAGRVLDGRQAGEGNARLNFTVSKSGKYVLWVRLQGQRAPTRARQIKDRIVEAPAESRSVQVEIRQEERTVVDASVASKGLIGPLASDFVWTRLNVELNAGAARLSLSKVNTGHTGLRVVDCLLLTSDADYVPDVRDFHEQVYARQRVGEDAAGDVAISNLLRTPRLERGVLFGEVAPGRTSAWRNITRWSEGAGDASLPLRPQSKSGKGTCYLDVASAPDEQHVVKTIPLGVAHGQLHVMIPPEVARSVPQSSLDLARARARLVAGFPAIPFGRRPTAFPLLVDLRADAISEEAEKDVVVYTGVNGFATGLNERDLARGFSFTRVYNSAFYLGPSGYVDADWSRMRADLAADAKARHDDPNWSRVQHLKLIDEAMGPFLTTIAEDGKSQAAFREWWKKQRLSTIVTGIKRPRLVSDRSESDPRLYYYSQKFRAHLVADFFRRATELAHELYPPGVKTTQNLSDGPVIYANMYAQGNDYFEYFKSGALDVALSEDWTNASATSQLCGWNVALLRAATKYRHQPIHMYNIAYSSRRPIEVKLKAYSDIAQGTKLLDIYSYTPRYLGGEVGWAENPPMIEAVAELSREIGAAEQVLLGAMPVKAQVALLYSIPGDIWDAGFDITLGNERMLTYLLLRHAQIASDVLSDADVEEGRLSGYRVAYLNDAVLPLRSARRLEAWVRAGGMAVLGVDGGTRDEFNGPSRYLSEALGIKRRNQRTTGPTLLPTGSYDKLPPDLASLRIGPNGEAFRAPLRINSFEEDSQSDVLARFDDGQPAVISRRVGKGSVLAFGFLPATVYLRNALLASNGAGPRLQTPPPLLAEAFRRASASTPATSPIQVPAEELWGPLLTDYPAAVRALVAAPAVAATRQPVAADQPLVETTMLEGERGFVVPLANYSGGMLPRVTLRVRPSGRVTAIRSARLGELASDTLPDGTLVVHLPLETTDFVFGEWTAPQRGPAPAAP
jgi:hypothetical protein